MSLKQQFEAAEMPDIAPELLRFLSKLTKEEQKALASSGIKPPRPETNLPWSKATFCMGVLSDTHIGHKGFQESWLLRAFDRFEKARVDLILHVGDVLEGMSGRPGHVYELEHVGYSAQVEAADRLFRQAPAHMKFIIGNHDLWGLVKGDIGFEVGEDLQVRLGADRVSYLGQHEADIVVNGLRIRLWHGMDGAAYATSYRGQKIVESISGGDKPHVLLLGHAHKSMAFTARNIRVFESGCLSAQSSWMRYTRKEACPGVWIITLHGEGGDLERVEEEWIPFYL